MAFLEMSVHLHGVHFNPLAKGLLHLFSTVCICANIFAVSIITFVSVWGSGKALRGKDGSMSMVVEGMNKERWLIFYTFGIGLLSLLCAVACSTWLLMQREVRAGGRCERPTRVHDLPRSRTLAARAQVALLATMLLLATCYALISNAMRIFKKFELQAGEVVRFSDFLKALPKADEANEEEYDEEEMNVDPTRAVV